MSNEIKEENKTQGKQTKDEKESLFKTRRKIEKILEEINFKKLWDYEE